MTTRKPLLLVLAGCAGGLAVTLWPLLARHLPHTGINDEGPPLVSVEEAQRQISYPLWVPREIPAGGQMIGAVLYRIKAPDLPGEIARAQAERHYYTGYGLLFMELNGVIRVIGIPGSPAEREGLERAATLLAINGHSVAGKTRQAVKSAALRTPPPLVVTFRALDGTIHTIRLRPERFITHPGVPHVYRGKLSGLDFHVRGRSIDLQEWPIGEAPPPYGYHFHRVKVGGTTVLMADSDRGPVAFWTQGPTQFVLDDTAGALSGAEELRLIQSLYLPHSRAK
jgi:hypothetical protein